MKIRILFYKAKIGDKHWIDDAINIHTSIFNFPKPRLNLKKWWQEIKRWWKGPYSHVELWVPDLHRPHKEHFENDFDFSGPCYTSTMRPPHKGVVKRPASEVLKHPRRWDYCEIEVDEDLFNKMIARVEFQIAANGGYDFKAIVSFFWFKRVHDTTKWICSELVWYLLWIVGVKLNDKGDGKYKCPSPRRLSRWLTKKGYKIRSLT